MAKSADDASVPPICVAIRAALDVHHESLRAFASRAGVSLSQLQRWSGRSPDGPGEPRLDAIRKLESGLRPDAPAGWLLIAAGAVEVPHTAEDAIRADVRLNEAGVRMVLNVLREAVDLSSEIQAPRSAAPRRPRGSTS